MGYPKVGEKFQLTLTQDQCDGIAMVKNFGYNNSEDWKHNGKIPETLTIECELVQIGFCSNLDEAREKLEKLGKIPNGLFLQSFKDEYPEPDGNGPIGIADPSWVDPLGFASFPSVHSDGDPRFRWTGHDLDGDWRWLVLSK